MIIIIVIKILIFNIKKKVDEALMNWSSPIEFPLTISEKKILKNA